MLPRLSVSTFSVAGSSDVHVCLLQGCLSQRATLCLKVWRSLKKSSGSFIRQVTSIPPDTGGFKCHLPFFCGKADHVHPVFIHMVCVLILLYNTQRSVKPPALCVYRLMFSEHTLRISASVGFSAVSTVCLSAG